MCIRDRLIPKHQTRWSGFDDKILSLYARGMTVRAVSYTHLDVYKRQVYVSAFRAVDELARDADGQPLPPAERERLFDFLLTLLQNESSSASLNDIKSRLSALVA